MKLRNDILEKVRNSTEIRREFARQLDVSDASIGRYLKENAENGELTKVIAIKIIAEKLVVSEDLILL
jgi:DeoR/GlpR family transcriptional regulator of sugar metabolism